MTREEKAFQILLAILSAGSPKIDLYPQLGEKQIRTCFELARVFERVARDAQDVDAVLDREP